MATKKMKFDAFNIAVIVLGILIVVLAIAAFVNIFRGYSEFTNGADTILNDINRHNYSYAVSSAYNDRELGKNGDDYRTPYAAVDYLNAAVLYNACIKAENAEKAKEYKAEMSRAYDNMGQLAESITGDIDTMLGG